MPLLIPVLSSAAAYLLGSITWAVIISRWLNKPDPRQKGSQNPGTTNVLRTGGRWAAVLTLLGDALKGFLPVFLARQLGLSSEMSAWIGLFAFLGHLYPIFFRFKGGKGVATAFGVTTALSPALSFGLLLIWGGILGLTRYVSLASIIVALLAPFALGWHSATFWPLSLLSLLLIWRHRTNLQRLTRSKEPKLGQKVSNKGHRG